MKIIYISQFRANNAKIISEYLESPHTRNRREGKKNQVLGSFSPYWCQPFLQRAPANNQWSVRQELPCVAQTTGPVTLEEHERAFGNCVVQAVKTWKEGRVEITAI